VHSCVGLKWLVTSVEGRVKKAPPLWGKRFAHCLHIESASGKYEDIFPWQNLFMEEFCVGEGNFPSIGSRNSWHNLKRLEIK
jgi:hypothetical protein